MLQSLPHCRPAEYESWLHERGLEPFDAQDRVFRGPAPHRGPAPAFSTRRFEVQAVDAAAADEWAAFLQRVYRLDTGCWLKTVRDGVARLYERLEPLLEAGRLACVLWLLPASFERDGERLTTALDALPAGRHAFEFRHPGWFADGVLALLAERDVALVRGDDARRELPVRASPASWSFVRLHYGHRGRNGNYGPTELDAWAAAIAARAGRGDDVFVYANNDWNGFAPRNAIELRERLDLTPY